MHKRVSIWKFEPLASEARDNELTATSNSDWGGCVKTRKSTTCIVLKSRTQGSVSLSSAEAEYHGRVVALAEAQQVQRIPGEYHEDHSGNGIVSSQSKRSPCGGKLKIPAVCFHEPRGMVATSRYEEQCCRRFGKVSESTNAAEHVDLTKNWAGGTSTRESVQQHD